LSTIQSWVQEVRSEYIGKNVNGKSNLGLVCLLCLSAAILSISFASLLCFVNREALSSSLDIAAADSVQSAALFSFHSSPLLPLSFSPFTRFSEAQCDVVALCHRLLGLSSTMRRLPLLTDVLPSLPYFLGITPTPHHLLQPLHSPRQLPLSTILQSVIDRGTYTIDLIRNSSLDLYTTSSST